MAKYIDADALMDELNNQFRDMDNNVYDSQDDALEDAEVSVRQIIHSMPAADVEPVEHGEWWNEYDDYSVAKCSNCGTTLKALDDEHYNGETLWELFKRKYSHCPNCGALMDENETDEREEMYAIPNSEPPTYTPEEKAKITEWCEEAGIDPNMIRGMKELPKTDGDSK